MGTTEASDRALSSDAPSGAVTSGSTDWVSSQVLKHPWYTLLGALCLTVLAGILSSLSIPGKLWLLLNPPPAGTPAILPGLISTIVDVGFGILFPAAIFLATTMAALRGLIGKERERDVGAAGRLDHFKSEIELTVLNATSRMEAATTAQLAEFHRDVELRSEAILSQVDTVLPSLRMAAQDDILREKITHLTKNLAASPFLKDASQRIILRSLVSGMVKRLDALLKTIGTKGSYMDPEERRELTLELFRATTSYHVLFYPVRSPKAGSWSWHPGYLDFIREAAQQHPGNVTWTFIDWPTSEAIGKEQAITDVRALGVPCYIFDASGRGEEPRDVFDGFFSHGPMIEIFGSSFAASSKEIPPGSRLTWKATSLVRKTGRTSKKLEAVDIDAMAGAEGVWAADDVEKLVRLGVVDGPGPELTVLSQIVRWRTEPDGPCP